MKRWGHRLSSEERKRRRSEAAKRWRAAHPGYFTFAGRGRIQRMSPEQREAHFQLRRLRERERHRSWKARAFMILGNECLRCGFSDHRALTIDHVADDGAEHRNSLRAGTVTRWVVFHPAEAVQRVQILCANCNTIKECFRKERGRKAA